MKVSEGRLGRVFIVQLEAGDDAVETVERVAAEKGVRAAQVFMAGGISLAGIVASGPGGAPKLRIPPDLANGRKIREETEIMIQEVIDMEFFRTADSRPGSGAATRAASGKTRVMDKASPVPEESGMGTVPVYLVNAEFN